MWPGPFDANIMPVRSDMRYDDVAHKWIVKASRAIKTDEGGFKREITRQSFDVYADAISFVSVFFGNK